MTYRPASETYGPPLSVRLPSILYLALAIVVLVLVLVAQSSPSGTFLHNYLVMTSKQRYISAPVFAALLLVSAIASFVQAGMRGVRVQGDGVEYRDLVNFAWPKVRRFKWAQIDRVVFDTEGMVVLDLWDGSRALLPPVRDPDRLADTLERVALARAIPVSGGRGVDEIPEPGEYE